METGRINKRTKSITGAAAIILAVILLLVTAAPDAHAYKATETADGNNHLYTSGSTVIKVSDGTNTNTYTLNASWSTSGWSWTKSTQEARNVSLSLSGGGSGKVTFALGASSVSTQTNSGIKAAYTSTDYGYLKIPVRVTCPAGYKYSSYTEDAYQGGYGWYTTVNNSQAVTFGGQDYSGRTATAYFIVSVHNLTLRTHRRNNIPYKIEGNSCQFNFSPITYSVRYNANGGGGSMAASTHTYDMSAALTSNTFTRTGYTFDGWNTRADGNGASYANRQTVKNLTASDGSTVDLYAQWEPVSSQLTFHPNGGTFAGTTGTSTRTVTYGQSDNNSPGAASRAVSGDTGYRFRGWYTSSSGGTQVFDAAGVYTASGGYWTSAGLWNGTSGLHLYAQWEEVPQYTITYDLDGGTASNPIRYDRYTSAFSLAAPVRTGYSFAGWTGSNGQTPQKTVTIAYGSTGDREYKANWTANTYMVRFNGNGSTSGSMAAEEMTYDQTKALTVNAFVRSGYTFKGWSRNADGTGAFFYNQQMVSNLSAVSGATVDLYAQWEPVEYTLSYDLEGGTVTPENPKSYTVETPSFTLRNPVRKGYTFAGWQEEGAEEPVKEVTVPKGSSGSRIFTAVWQPNIYTIHYDGNGSSSGEMTDREAVYDTGITLPSCGFMKTGHHFAGWNTRADGSGTAYADQQQNVRNLTDAPEGTVTLYAMWEANTYSISFRAGGGSGEMEDADGFTYGQPKALPDLSFTKEGYRFTGWNTRADGSGTTYADQEEIRYGTEEDEGTLILYARWEPIHYTIRFHGNTGEGSMEDMDLAYDETRRLLPCAFAKAGHTFAGWAREESAEHGIYADAQNVRNLAKDDGAVVTLYAVWSTGSYDVIFNAAGGSGSMEYQHFEYDEEKPLQENTYTRKGWRFLGWALNEDEEMPAFADRQPVKNICEEGKTTLTLYAVWEPVRQFQADSITVSGVRAEEFTVEEGGAEFRASIRSGERFFIPGLDRGAGFEVTESGEKFYKPSYEFEEGDERAKTPSDSAETGMDLKTAREILLDNARIACMNEKQDHQSGTDITLRKTVDGDLATEEDQEKRFVFWYSLSGLDPDTEYSIEFSGDRDAVKYTSDESGRAQGRILLASAEQAVMKDLPSGARYQFEEVLREDPQETSKFIPKYEVTKGEDYVNSAGGYGETATDHGFGLMTEAETVVQNREITFDFTNSAFEKHDITIDKSVLIDGAVQRGTSERFDINVQLTGLEPNTTYLYSGGHFSSDAKGRGSILTSLGSGAAIVIEDIPGTASCEVYEAASGYIPSILAEGDGAEGIYAQTASLYEAGLGASLGLLTSDTTIHVMNERNTKNDLSVTKEWAGPLAETYTGAPEGREGDPFGGEAARSVFEIRLDGLAPGGDYRIAKSKGGQSEEGGSGAGSTAGVGTEHGKPDSDETSEYFTADMLGRASVTVELEPNETARLLQLPEQATYKITEHGMEKISAEYAVQGNISHLLHLKSPSGQAGRGEDLSTPTETMEFSREYVFCNNADFEAPKKTVSDEDTITLSGPGKEENVKENTVRGLKSRWTYHLSQDIPCPVTSFQMIDSLPPLVTVELAEDTGAEFWWITPDGSRYGGTPQMVQAEGGTDAGPGEETSAEWKCLVIDGSRAIFQIEADGIAGKTELEEVDQAGSITAEGEIRITLIDEELLSAGGRFEATLPARLSDGVTAQALQQAGLASAAGFTVQNNAYTLINEEMFEAGPADTNIYMPQGIAIKKQVPEPGDPEEEFTFTMKLSGLETGRTYSFGTLPFISQEEGLYTFRAKEDGTQKISFELRDGEQVVFYDLNPGAVYEITEDESGYRASYEVTYGQAAVKSASRARENTKVMQKLATGENVVLQNAPVTFLFTNAAPTTNVKFSKTQVNGSGELPGAHLYVVSGQFHPDGDIEEALAKARVIEDWISGDAPHEIELARGNAYTLVELTAPEGFLRAEEIVFRITEAGTIEQLKKGSEDVWTQERLIRMEDAQDFEIQIEKRDAVSGAFVEGAQLALFDEEGHQIETWTTNDQARTVRHLTEGKYRLKEVSTPDGERFLPADPITFIIAHTGFVTSPVDGAAAGTTIRMYDECSAQIAIGKYDINGTDELPGASLCLTEAETGDEIDAWISEEVPRKVNLIAGREYILTERIAPENYELAEDIHFKVSAEGTVMVKGPDGTFLDRGETELRMLDAPQGPDGPDEPQEPEEPTLHDIILVKKVTGDLGDRSKQFEFTVTFTGLEPDAEYDMGRPFAADENGKASLQVKLRDDEKVTFHGIPDGASYQVSEAASDHAATYRIISDQDDAVIRQEADTNGNTSDKALSTERETVDPADGTVTIRFRNHRSLAVTTGVPGGGRWPLIALAVLAAALAGILVRARISRTYERLSEGQTARRRE